MTSQRGFTIIELLIAIMLSLAALAAGYTIFSGSGRAVAAQTQESRMQDNARMAMDVLARNFRRVGLLIRTGNYPLATTIPGIGSIGTGTNSENLKLIHLNRNDGPDDVTLAGGNPGWQTTLSFSAPKGANMIIVNDASQITVGSLIGIGYLDSAVVLGVAGTVITLDTAVPSGATDMDFTGVRNVNGTLTNKTPLSVIGIGSARFNIGMDNGIPILFQNGQPLAEGIEDLQIEYGIDANQDKIIQPNEWTSTPDAPDMRRLIRLVRITIVARADYDDPALRGAARMVPPDGRLFYGDRPAWQTSDGFRRLVLTRIVKCRNMEYPDSMI
jgi:type IV pilus assembly protein PilW